MLFLPEGPTVIRPQDHDRIVPFGTLFQGIQQTTHIHIGVGDGRQVGLNGNLPTAAFQKLLMIPLRACHANATSGNVV